MKKYIILGLVLFLLPIFFIVLLFLGLGNQDRVGFVTGEMTEEIEVYRPIVAKYAEQYEVSDYVDVLMAILMQESGGKLPDIMQSSESVGLLPNTITDPERSIDYGVRHFKRILDGIKSKELKAVVQGYNYGVAWCEYVNRRGGKWTQRLAETFADKYARIYGRDTYGDRDYVPHVFRYLVANDGRKQTYSVARLLSVMRPFIGKVAYEFGARDPRQGKVDCSGLVEYSFNQIGIDLSGTAQTQYDKTARISESQAKVGDLVFFETYRKGASHVGVYVGSDKFINANANGVEYSNLSIWSKVYPFLGFGRVIQ